MMIEKGGDRMMPVIFIGHGTPMNAIEDNVFTREWKTITASLPKPEAILSISAHWVTNGTKVSILKDPETIHDFYGFPKALFDVEYRAPGSPEFAAQTIALLGGTGVADESWGIDHGTWSVLHVMYPKADIPVYQVSLDYRASAKDLMQIGRMLAPLRERGVLIMGSGNVVHNLGMVDFRANGGYDWAVAFDDFIYGNIIKGDFQSVLGYKSVGKDAERSVPTTEHFNPLLCVLGATNGPDDLTVYNRSCVYGSLSMTSYVFSGHKAQGWMEERK